MRDDVGKSLKCNLWSRERWKQFDRDLELCRWVWQQERMFLTGPDRKLSHKHSHDHSLTDQVVRRCLKLLIGWPILHQSRVTCNLRLILKDGQIWGSSVFLLIHPARNAFVCLGFNIMLAWMPADDAASFFLLSPLYLIVYIKLKGIPKILQRWIKNEQWWRCCLQILFRYYHTQWEGYWCWSRKYWLLRREMTNAQCMQTKGKQRYNKTKCSKPAVP